jgi:hypothetical protein
MRSSSVIFARSSKVLRSGFTALAAAGVGCCSADMGESLTAKKLGNEGQKGGANLF